MSVAIGNTLSKKRNATNLAVFILSIFLTAQKVLDGLFIRYVTDRLWVVIQAEECLFQYIMPHFGPSHCWSVATSAVCCFDWIFFPDDNLVWGKKFARIFFCVKLRGAARAGRTKRGHQDVDGRCPA